MKNEYTGNYNNLPPVIIGECRLPISQIANENGDNFFDGTVEIKLRNFSTIGNLKILVALSDKNFDGHDEFYKKIAKGKIIDDMDMINVRL